MKFFENTELEGELVVLTPMDATHREALIEASADGELWNLWYTNVPEPHEMESYMAKALKDYNNDTGLAFVVKLKETGRIIGSTRFANAAPEHRRLEIGYTWYAKSYQRTGVNTECKYLLLSHAFETLRCISVEFRTSWMNHASRNAILRLGTKQDGVLRNYWISKDGSYRDVVVFSIIESEWPACKRHLEFKMGAHKQVRSH